MDQKLVLVSLSSIGIIVLINHIKNILNRRKLLRNYYKNKTILITGASSGLGEALAKELYSFGAKLILCSRRMDELNRVRDNLLSQSLRNCQEPECIQLDVCDNLNIIKEKLDFIVTKNGPIHILINNAGISYRGECLNTKQDVYKRLMDVNYYGPIKLTNFIIDYIINNNYQLDNKYSIVNIGSVQSLLSIPYRSAYSASKHALLAYTDALRAELKSKYSNIQVLSVYPGYINTNLSINAIKDTGNLNEINDHDPKQSMSPDYVASQIIYSVYMNKNELFLSIFIHRLALWLRFFFPSLYHFIMKKRALKKPF